MKIKGFYLVGGDGSIDVPIAWVKLAKEANKRIFKVELTEDNMRLIL